MVDDAGQTDSEQHCTVLAANPRNHDHIVLYALFSITVRRHALMARFRSGDIIKYVHVYDALDSRSELRWSFALDRTPHTGRQRDARWSNDGVAGTYAMLVLRRNEVCDQ